MIFLETLKKRVIVLDGAMGTMIQDLDLSDADFGGSAYKMLSDLLTFSRPRQLKDIHLKYYRAGADAVETNTFGASTLRLQEYDFSGLDVAAFASVPGGVDLRKLSHDDFAYHLSRSAAELAREARDERRRDADYDGRPLFVIGSIGPSNWVLTSTNANLRRATYAQIVDNFYNQSLGLIDGGADVLLFETQQDPLELKAAVHGGQKAMREKGVKIPIMAQVTVDAYGKMQIFNTDVTAALTMIQDIGVDVFGINCSIGPDLMAKTVARIAEVSPLPISVIPNAGLPVSENGRTVFKFTPDDFAAQLGIFADEFGVNVVGGCCGTRPDHIAKVAAVMKGKAPKPRSVKKRVFVSGPQNAVELDSGTGLIRIAERLNVRGSKKVKDAVEGSDPVDFEILEEVMLEQVRDLGVPLIDVCMDSNQVNTEDVLVQVVQKLTTDFKGAMCLDSFSVEALVAAVEVYPGRPIVNSISMEEYAPGLDKIDAVVGKTWQHAPVYVGLATGPKGPGATAEQKAGLARQIYEKCRDKYGVRADQLIIDVNAFPIGSESDEKMNFAMESILAIPLVKKIHPDLKVSMGVGNLTTGLGKKPYMRKVLTSVFVDEARKAGLDAAIINPDHYVPVESLDPADVTLALKAIRERDMEAFARLEEISEERKGGPAVKKLSYDELPLEQAICQKIKDGFKQRIAGRVEASGFVYDYVDAIVVQVAEALKTHAPLEFINKHLMAAMKELGDGFGRGEVSLPHLLKSADVMKQAMGYIEAFMRHSSGKDVHAEIAYKGTVVVGTVYQDVHSIGKDLVKTLLENYGYRVIDLGVQTPLERFVEEAKTHKADAVGMSALLVQTSNHMITVARMLQEAGLGHVDILIGGAPVNLRHAAYVSLHGEDDPARMLPNVFYCPSGMDGVNTMNQLKESEEKRGTMYRDNLENLKWHYEHAVRKKSEDEHLLKTLPRRTVSFDGLKRDASKCQAPGLIRMTLGEFSPHLDLKALFSLNWRYGGKSGWEKKGVSEDFLKTKLAEWVRNCDREGWIVPQGAFGLFQCYGHDDEVVLHDPVVHHEIARVPFTPVIGAGKKDVFSAAQYFYPRGSETWDIIGLQVTTAGIAVEKQIAAFKARGDTESAHFLQGLADRVAEDMAQYVHGRLREFMGVSAREGQRYSPGYPALKDLAVNRTITKLLNAEKTLGIRLTEADEFDPPGTTGAVACFHPDAGYE
jgi:5-methyltetrahydrofolate--homocysteine methyltransferase